MQPPRESPALAGVAAVMAADGARRRSPSPREHGLEQLPLPPRPRLRDLPALLRSGLTLRRKRDATGGWTQSRRISNPYLEHTPSQKLFLKVVSRIHHPEASLVAQLVKNLPAMQSTPVWSTPKSDLCFAGATAKKDPTSKEKLHWVRTGRLASRTLSFHPVQIYGHRGLAAPYWTWEFCHQWTSIYTFRTPMFSTRFRLMSVTICTGSLRETRHGRMVSDSCCSLCLSFPVELASVNCFPDGSGGEASAHNAGDLGSIPGLGRSLGEGNDNPLQYSCLENPMDGGA